MKACVVNWEAGYRGFLLALLYNQKTAQNEYEYWGKNSIEIVNGWLLLPHIIEEECAWSILHTIAQGSRERNRKEPCELCLND